MSTGRTFSWQDHLWLLEASGAVYWAAEKTVLLADLHLEKGSAMAQQGSLLPPYDSRATLDAIEQTLARLQPERVICLGDSFQDRMAWLRMPEDDRARLRNFCLGLEWIWIHGNHDNRIPEGPSLPGTWSTRWHRAGVNFFHGGIEYLKEKPAILGHYHPKHSLKARGKSITRPCVVAAKEIMVLPAFGRFTGGLSTTADVWKDPLFSGASLYLVPSKGEGSGTA